MKGNKESEFLQMIGDYQRIMHNICRTYTDNRIDHDDLFQEMVTQLWVGYDKFKRDSKISTWIYRVSLYTAITYIKKVMKDREISKNMSSEEYTVPKTEESNEELLLTTIKKLDESDRAFVLLYLEDRTYKEMGDILGISESNVGVKLNRIKKKLKTLMKVK